jgi:hydroxyacylglutathione hydrolase
LIGDDAECVVIDAPHELDTIVELIGERTLLAVLCTHAHDDHVTVAPQLAAEFDAPVWLHPDDDVLWQLSHPDEEYEPIGDGQRWMVAGVEIEALHTPGHSPGAVSFYAPSLGAVFTGDTLFHGGPGATGRSYSDYDIIVASIRERLFILPGDTTVHTGHGEDTIIGAEQQNLDESE